MKKLLVLVLCLIIFSSAVLAATQNNGVPFQQLQTSVDGLQTQVNSLSVVIVSNNQTDANQQNQINTNTAAINSFFDIFTEINLRDTNQQAQINNNTAKINSFFDIFTEIRNLYGVDSFFDVFTEIRATDANQQNQITGLQSNVNELEGRVGVLENTTSGKICTSNSDCDDGNPCTHDECDSGFCSETSNSYAEACYTGPVSTRNIGECSDGVRTCSSGVFGACSGQVLPVLESCSDNQDNDCDGTIDEESSIGCFNLFRDDDADGYGRTSAKCLCAGSYPYTAISSGDCNDANSVVNPGATEKCSTAFDDDCDGQANEQDAISCASYFFDNDNDGYGLSSLSKCLCAAAPPYKATSPNDCNDVNANMNPGKAEICDGIDNDCDSAVDEGC